MFKIQIAKKIFLVCLTIMKSILDLAEFKLGKQSEDYKYFKKQTMKLFYDNISKLFDTLAQEGLIQKCSCKNKIKDGYANCVCGGSEYINKV